MSGARGISRSSGNSGWSCLLGPRTAAFLKKACLDQSLVSGPSIDFPFALEGFVTKPFHLEKMKDFLVDGLLSSVTVVSRDRMCWGRCGPGGRWHSPCSSRSHLQLPEVKSILCLFCTGSSIPSKCTMDVPKRGFVLDHRAVSWI